MRWVLICVFVVLAAYYQANITQHLDYPRESEVNANYAKYVGQNVTISGGVVATGVGSFQLKGEQRYLYNPLVGGGAARGERHRSRYAPARAPAARGGDVRLTISAGRTRLRPLVYCAHRSCRALFRELAV